MTYEHASQRRRLAWLSAALLVGTGAEAAVEQRLKVTGTWQNERFVVTSVEERDPGKDATRLRVRGRVHTVDRGAQHFSIGPVAIEWSGQQAGLVESLREGDVLEVDARLIAGWRFQLLALRPDDIDSPDAVELIGAVTGIERAPEARESRVELVGIPSWVPVSLYNDGRIRLGRLDDKRPDDQFRAEIGKVAVTLGGELEVVTDYEADRDLDRSADDGVASSEQQFQLETYFELGDSVTAFVELDGGLAQERDVEAGTTERGSRLRRGETWVYWDQPFGSNVGLQIGRQNFAEQREWWWDENLDAIRVLYGSRRFSWEVALAEELGRVEIGGVSDPERLDVRRVIATVGFRPSSAVRVDGFYLRQSDHSDAYRLGERVLEDREDEDDSNLAWLGFRLSGGLDLFADTEVEYWLDAAVVRGDEVAYGFADLAPGELLVDEIERRRRDGRGVDLGLSVSWQRWSRFRPTLTLGYAQGSGGSDEQGWFRQTGLNDNNGRYNGVDRFRYYGEVARPQLENLAISTVSLGLRVKDNSSIELAYHAYEQVTASDRHALRVDPDANALSRALGSELDIVVGLEEWKHWEIELVGGYFVPGSAFDARDPMWLGVVKVNYNF
jgi:hypothetical protein